MVPRPARRVRAAARTHALTAPSQPFDAEGLTPSLTCQYGLGMDPHANPDGYAPAASRAAASRDTPWVIEPDAALPSVPLHPAPWQLHGWAYMLVVRLPDDMLDSAAFVPADWVPKRRTRTAIVLFVDYETSPCGPYRELLVAPAAFDLGQGSHPAISRIFVSTYDSVVNGRNNWGIPKDRADFEVVRDPARHTDRLRLSRDGHTFAELELRSRGPALPVRTGLLPPGIRTLVQSWQGKAYRTKLAARGKARLASLASWRFDPEYFPDLSRGRVLVASHFPDFDMTFPVADVASRENA